jgi:hypothetical protein
MAQTLLALVLAGGDVATARLVSPSGLHGDNTDTDDTCCCCPLLPGIESVERGFFSCRRERRHQKRND